VIQSEAARPEATRGGHAGRHNRPEEGAGGGEEGLPKQLREDMRLGRGTRKAAPLGGGRHQDPCSR